MPTASSSYPPGESRRQLPSFRRGPCGTISGYGYDFSFQYDSESVPKGIYSSVCQGGAAPMMDSDNDDESVTDGGKSLPTPLTPIEQPKLLEEKSSSEERLKVSEEPSKMPSPVPAPRSRKSVSPKELTGSLSATEFDNITTEPKLQHLVKSRPKRPKVHAASRTSLIRSSSIDDGLGEFFEGPPKQGSFETDSESSARASKESLTDIGGSRSPSRPMSSADDRSDDEKLEPKTPSSEEKPKTDPISPLSPKRPPGVRMALPGLGDAGGAALLADMKARQASRKNKEKSSPEKEINSSESLEDKPAETAIPVSPKKPPGVRMALPGLGEAGGAALLADIKTRQAIRKGEDKEKAQPKTTGSATESTREKEKEKITREKDKDKDESFKDSNRLSRPPPALKPKPLWSKPKLAEKPTTAPPKPSGYPRMSAARRGIEDYDNVQPNPVGGGFQVMRPASGPKLKAPAPPPPSAQRGSSVLTADAFMTKQIEGFGLSLNKPKNSNESKEKNDNATRNENNNVVVGSKDIEDDDGELVMFV